MIGETISEKTLEVPEFLILACMAVVAAGTLRSVIRGHRARDSAAVKALTLAAMALFIGGVVPAVVVIAEVAAEAPIRVMIMATAAAVTAVASLVGLSVVTVAVALWTFDAVVRRQAKNSHVEK